MVSSIGLPPFCLAHSYKEDITSEQKEALLQVMRAHTHPLITPDIRREIVHSRSRDRELPMEPAPEAMQLF